MMPDTPKPPTAEMTRKTTAPVHLVPEAPADLLNRIVRIKIGLALQAVNTTAHDHPSYLDKLDKLTRQVALFKRSTLCVTEAQLDLNEHGLTFVVFEFIVHGQPPVWYRLSNWA